MKFIPAFLLLFTCLSTRAQKQISLSAVNNYIGDSVVFASNVSGVKYLPNAKGAPTLINFGGAYPNHLLTVVIRGADRKNFGTYLSDEFLKGKNVTVAGKVALYQNKPQLVVKDPDHFRFITDSKLEINKKD